MESQHIWVMVVEVREIGSSLETPHHHWAGQLLSEDDAAPAQSLSTSCHGCWGGDRSEVGMDFDVRELSLETRRKCSLHWLFLGLWL